MHGYRIIPIPAAIAEAVRTTGRSPQYGYLAHVEINCTLSSTPLDRRVARGWSALWGHPAH
jgi:hypothetical protein